MPKKSTKTTKVKATKQPSGNDTDRDESGRFTKGNAAGVKFASGIDAPGEEHPKLKRTCKYEPRFAEMLIDYYNEPMYDEYTDSFGKVYRMSRPIPSKVGFARRIGVWFDTVENWAKMTNEDGTPMFPEFKAAWELTEKYSKQNIIDASNDGVHNANFGKFLLSAVHGMKEQSAAENTMTIRFVNENTEIDEESQ